MNLHAEYRSQTSDAQKLEAGVSTAVEVDDLHMVDLDCMLDVDHRWEGLAVVMEILSHRKTCPNFLANSIVVRQVEDQAEVVS